MDAFGSSSSISASVSEAHPAAMNVELGKDAVSLGGSVAAAAAKLTAGSSTTTTSSSAGSVGGPQGDIVGVSGGGCVVEDNELQGEEDDEFLEGDVDYAHTDVDEDETVDDVAAAADVIFEVHDDEGDAT